jgi:hypothetical protein
MENNQWSFAKAWNGSIPNRKEREIVPRDYIYASELGKAPVDIFLRMKGIKPTNPPNDRSRRKFEAGNIWEWIIRLILVRAGILQSSQESISFQYEGLQRVSGRLDFIAGGKPDYEKALEEIQKLDMPDVFLRGFESVFSELKERFPDGLDSRIIEVKSVSAFMFNGLEATGKSSKNHRLQNFHYLKAKDMREGSIVYICRDDCRMLEVPVFNPSSVEDEYKEEIEKISRAYQADIQPELEKAIIFDEDTQKFSKNWRIAYSDYLTMLYGFKDQKEFDDKYVGMVGKWNRVVGRIKRGDKMTPKNEEVIKEIREAGYNIDEIITKFSVVAEEEETTI